MKKTISQNLTQIGCKIGTSVHVHNMSGGYMQPVIKMAAKATINVRVKIWCESTLEFNNAADCMQFEFNPA